MQRTRPCSICGTPRRVVAKSREEIVCHPCRRIAKGIGPSGRMAPNGSVPWRPKVRACVDCLAAFTSDKYDASPRCQDCRRKRRNRQHEARKRIRRARISGVFVEDVVIDVLLERDSFTCGICGYAIEPGLDPNDPWEATVDHVVPIAEGGEHSYRNTQPAHRWCNSVKGARADAA